MVQSSKNNPLRCIIRNNTSCAWDFSVTRYKQSIRKCFSDVVYGGKQISLCAAIIYRDECLKNFAADKYKIWFRELQSGRNKSGIVGVSRSANQRKDGSEYFVWYAAWKTADGKRVMRAFSEATYGKREAKQLACQARLDGVAESDRVYSERQAAILKDQMKFDADIFFYEDRNSMSTKDLIHLLLLARERDLITPELLAEIREVVSKIDAE